LAAVGPRREEGGGEVGVDRRPPASERHLGDGDVLRRPHAGVGHAGVEPTEGLDGCGHERVGLRLVAQVGSQRDAADLGGQRLRRLGVRVIVHADAGALGGQQARGCGADAA
jgi:hypothetical protein